MFEELNSIIENKKIRKIKVWIRDDDFSRVTDRFIIFSDLISRFGYKALISVIPFNFFINQRNVPENLLNKYDFYYCMHGWRHRVHMPESSEYGNNRVIGDVLKEIILSRYFLSKFFKTKYLDVFVPPYNSITEHSLRYLSMVELKYVSLGKNVPKNLFGIKNFSIDLGFDAKDNVNSFKEKLIQFIKSSDEQEISLGILTHHLSFTDETMENLSIMLEYMASNSVFYKEDPRNIFN